MTARNLGFTVFSIALWAILLVVSRIVLLVYQLDPWAFTFIQLISGGGVLIALSAGGAVDWRSLRRPSTWAYGVLRVTTAAAFTAALVHVSVVHGGLLGTINITLGVLGALLFFGRKPTPNELPGHLIILVGIALLIPQLADGWRNPAILLMLVSEVAVVTSSLIAERHPDNNASDPRARLRFTGVVLLLTAVLFLVLRIVQTGLIGSAEIDWATLFSPQLWIIGVLVGTTLRGSAMHTSLKAIRLVGTETYVIVAILLPFIGWGFEFLADYLGIIDTPPVPPLDLMLGALIASGSLFIILARRREASAA